MTVLRVLDTGLRPARENLAITEALRRGREAGTSPDTLRFQQFPRSAIVGRHQILAREVDLGWTAANGVEVARRMTGGGAIVMGPGLLGWELVLHRRAAPPGLDAASALLCGAVAEAIRGFGLPAAYRPRNDVEVGGRKVSGTGGYVEGDTLVFQGTVLIGLDLDFMASALILPARKLGKRGLSALAERVADLRGLLGGAAPPEGAVEAALAGAFARALGAAPAPSAIAEAELAAARAIHDAEIGTDAFVLGADDAPPPAGGRLLAHTAQHAGGAVEVVLKVRGGVVEAALLAGDFFAEPPSAVAALEARLRHRHLGEVAAVARDHLAASGARFSGIGAEEVVSALAAAAAEPETAP